MLQKNIIKVLSLVAIVGSVNALYLTYDFYEQSNAACSLDGGCGLVTKSVYNNLAGIPIALFGSGYFFLILLLVIYLYRRTNSRPRTYILFGWSLIGLGVSVYLTYLQFFVIKSLCPYCLLSATLSGIIFILMIVLLYYLKNTASDKI